MAALRKSKVQMARALRLLHALKSKYPDAKCALDWKDPHELLIATILSAQATDAAVNKATPALFKAFPTPDAFARASVEEIEPFLRTLNFWRMKSRALSESMRAVVREHQGRVPSTMRELIALRGVARKTANVVLGNAMGINEGVVVDTHVGRLALRMGLTRHDSPERAEQDLMALFPREEWCQLSHLLIAHGRSVCKARGARCESDELCREFCRNAKVTRKRAKAR